MQIAQWIATFPGVSGTAAGATPANDRVPNLLKYVLNCGPTASATGVLPTANAAGNNIVFGFTRFANSASDTTQLLEYGSDLASWTVVRITAPTDAAVSLGAPSGGLQSVAVTVPSGTNSKLFFRLKVSQP